MYDKKILSFVVFCIESIAEQLNVFGENVYKMLASDSAILDDYIIPNYESLHTQGKEYIVNDILECMRQEGLIG